MFLGKICIGSRRLFIKFLIRFISLYLITKAHLVEKCLLYFRKNSTIIFAPKTTLSVSSFHVSKFCCSSVILRLNGNPRVDVDYVRHQSEPLNAEVHYIFYKSFQKSWFSSNPLEFIVQHGKYCVIQEKGHNANNGKDDKATIVSSHKWLKGT